MDTIRHETRFPCPKLTILLPDYIFSMYEAYQVWPQARGRDLKPTVSNINQEGLLQLVPVVGLSHLEITYGYYVGYINTVCNILYETSTYF